MSYQIDLGQWNRIFAVPADLVDRHIKLATESQLKVILYILRHSGEEIGAVTLAKSLNISEEEAANAVDFWIERGLIALNNGSLAPAEQTASDVIPRDKPAEKQEPKKKTTVSRAVRPDTAYVAKVMQEDPLLVGLLDEAQTVLGKPLSPGDTATLVMLYGTFNLPCEVLALIINYVAEHGNGGIRAVEKIGIDWSDRGINTVEAAEKEIDRLTESREAWRKVSALMGIRSVGNPTKAQQEHAYCWTVIWGFNDEMIVEAYERCVNTKGEYNMRYINAILKKWYEKRIFSLDELANDEKASKKPLKSKSNGKGSVFSAENASFDLSKYEKQSLFDD